MNNKKILTFIIVSVLLLSVTVFAAENSQKIEAYLSNELNFLADGEVWSPKEVDDSTLTPILYKGRTYVPVRSLLEDKGVTVGYLDETKTVTLDYSTMERTQTTQTTQTTMPAYIKLEDLDSDTGKSTQQLTISQNPRFNLGNVTFTQEYSFDLDATSTLFLDGKQIDGNLEELVKSSSMWSADSVSFEIDEKTGLVNSTKISSSNGSGTGEALNAKGKVDVEISGSPFKIKITITF